MKFNLVYIFILMTSLCFSQEITKGNIVKDRQFLIDKGELTANDNQGNFISIRPHTINGSLRNYFVEFFENENFTDRIEIETKDDTEILKVFLLNHKAYVFIKERENRSITLKLNSVDLDTKQQFQQVIFSASKEENINIFRALKDSYNIKLLTDSSLVLSFPVVEDKELYNVVKIFSEDLKETADYKITAGETSTSKNTVFLNTFQIDGKIYSLFQEENNANENFYKLVETDNEAQRFLEIKIPDGTFELVNSRSRNKQMIISGLYSKYKKGGFSGFTYYNIDLNKFQYTSKQSPFLNENASRFFSGLFKGNRSIDIKDIFINDNLDTYIVAQFYILRKNVAPVGIPIASFTFAGVTGFITFNPVSSSYKVFDDILIGKINSSGELLWDNLLQLRQTEKISSKSNKRDSSTFTFFSNNEINILINGSIDEDKEELIVKQDKRPSKTNFYNITVNPHGGITPNILFSNKDSETIFRTENAVMSDNIIHILGQGNMRKQLLLLKI